MKSDEETVREADEELLEHRTQTDEEAGSVVLRVGNDMDEKELTDIVSGSVCLEDEIVMENKREEVNGAAAAKKTLETNDGPSKEDVEIRSLVEERRSTSKGEKQRLKDLSKHISKCIRDKKRAKIQEEIQTNTRRLQRDQEHSRNQICKWKKSTHHQDKNNEKGEVIASRKGIANVFG